MLHTDYKSKNSKKKRSLDTVPRSPSLKLAMQPRWVKKKKNVDFYATLQNTDFRHNSCGLTSPRPHPNDTNSNFYKTHSLDTSGTVSLKPTTQSSLPHITSNATR